MTEIDPQHVRRYGQTVVHHLETTHLTTYTTACGKTIPRSAALLTTTAPSCDRCAHARRRPEPGTAIATPRRFRPNHLLAPVHGGRARWDDAVPVRASVPERSTP